MDENQITIMLSIINFYLFLSCICVKYLQKIKEAIPSSFSSEYNSSLVIISITTFIIIFLFNLREASEIYSSGYSVLFDGTISVRKSLLIFMIEQIFLVSSILLLIAGSSLF